MRFTKRFPLILGVLAMFSFMQAEATPEVGKPAPNFAMKDINGKDVKLADLKGKIIVLEWSNFECPFVKKHYGSQNMQGLQKAYKDKVVWITVFSSAPGKEGHMATDKEAQEKVKAHDMHAHHVILDPKGEMGRAYEAKTTPHMFVINGQGNIAYMGAIDDDTSADPAKAKTAKNYVAAAIDAVAAGKPVEASATPPYGCSVKY